MKRTRCICLALLLALATLAVGEAYAADYYTMWSKDDNTVLIDGITYYDVYGAVRTRPDVDNGAKFLKDVLTTKKIKGDSPLDIWKSLSDRIARTYPRSFMIDGAYSYADMYSDLTQGTDLEKSYHNAPQQAVSLSAANIAIRNAAAGHINNAYSGERASISGSSIASLEGLDSNDAQDVFFSIDSYVSTPLFSADPPYGSIYTLSVANVFYDFRFGFLNTPDPIVSAAGDESDIDKAKTLPGVNYTVSESDKEFVNGVVNGSQLTLSTTETLSKTTELSTTVTHSTTTTHSTSESFGSDTKISFSYKFGSLFNEKTLGIEETFKYDKTTQETFAQTDSESTTTSQSSTHTSALSVTLPAHTKIVLEQGKGTIQLDLAYDHPLVVSYKVKQVLLFVEADYNPDGFSFSSSKSKAAGTFGRAQVAGHELAVDNLKKRVNNYAISGYEEKYGDNLDWGNILDESTTNMISNLTTNLPMSVTGGFISTIVESTISESYQTQPLYPIRRIAKMTDDGKPIQMSSGDVYYPENHILRGFNTYDVIYHGFDQRYGSWQLLDENLKVVPGGENEIAKLAVHPATGVTSLTAKDKSGTVYLKYLIDEDHYIESSSEGATTYTKNSDLTGTVIVEVDVKVAQDQYTINAAGGITTRVGDGEINLEDENSGVSVKVLDKDDMQVIVPIVWEAQEAATGDISINNNRLSVKKAGAYHIRPSYQGVHGNWLNVTVNEARALDSIVLTDDLYAEKRLKNDLLPVNGSYTLNLNDLRAKWLDQDGEEWKGAKTPVWSVTPNTGVTIDGDRATFTQAGLYDITLSSGNITSNPLSFRLVADRLAATPVISDQTRIRAYEQYEAVNSSNCLSVTASKTDDGKLSYQWYESATGDSGTFSPISGANESTYAPSTERQGAKWFRCVVTNTITIDLLDGRTVERNASRTTDDISVLVDKPFVGPDLLLGVDEDYNTGYGVDGTVDKPSIVGATGGVIVGLMVGETLVTFPQSEIMVKVVEKPTKLMLSASDLTLNPGESRMLSCTVEPIGARNNPKYESSDPSVATVSTTGLVMGVAVGQAIITAKSYNDKNAQPIRASCTVTVTDLDKTADHIEASGSITLPAGYNVTISDLLKAGTISAKVRNVAGEELAKPTADLVWSTNDTGIRISAGKLYALDESTPSDPYYTIVASYGQLRSTPIPVVVTPGPKLSSINLVDDQHLLDDTLIETGKTITRNLGILNPVLTDQYGDPWPVNTLLTWHVEPSGASMASISGSTLTVSAPGTYYIRAKARDITSDTLTFRVYLDVEAQAPVITKKPVSPVSVGQHSFNELLTIEASVTDGGVLSYQWYQVKDTTATPIAGETSASFAPPTARVGTTTYRCVVTNTLTLPEGSIRRAETSTGDIVMVIVEPSTGQDIVLGIGESHGLGYGAGAGIHYVSSAPSIADVSDSGVITAISKGSAVITVDMPVVVRTAKKAKGMVVTFRVTVVNYPDDITLSESELTLNPGQSRQITYKLTEGSAGSVTFSSDNKNVATVSNAGLVSAVSVGKATITATTYNQKKAKLTINVSQFDLKADRIEVAGSVTISKGSTISLYSLVRKGDLHVVVRDKNGVELSGATVSWMSNDKGLSISGDNLTALSQPSALQGYYTITARYNNLISSPIKVYVTPAQPLGGIMLGVNEKLDLSGVVGAPATYTTSDKKIATVNKSGVVKAQKVGKAVITAETIPTSPSGSVTTQYVINVLKAPKSITLSAKEATMAVGDTLVLTYTLPDNSAGKVTTNVVDPSVAAIDAYGRVTALAPGTTKIKFKTYNDKKASFKVTVKSKEEADPKLTSLTVEPSAVTIGVNEKITLTYKWEPANAQCVPERSVSNKKVKLAKKHAIKGVKAGTAVVTYTADGLKATVNVTVLKKPKRLNLNTEAMSLSIGEVQRITPIFVAGQGGSVTFKSDNEDVAFVNNAGLVTAKAQGVATITAKTYNGKTARCVVTVSN